MRDVSCPPERADVRSAAPREPPTDLANDPARLAIWNETEANRQSTSPTLVVSGCGTTRPYDCSGYVEDLHVDRMGTARGGGSWACVAGSCATMRAR